MCRIFFSLRKILRRDFKLSHKLLERKKKSSTTTATTQSFWWDRVIRFSCFAWLIAKHMSLMDLWLRLLVTIVSAFAIVFYDRLSEREREWVNEREKHLMKIRPHTTVVSSHLLAFVCVRYAHIFLLFPFSTLFSTLGVDMHTCVLVRLGKTSFFDFVISSTTHTNARYISFVYLLKTRRFRCFKRKLN